MVRDKRAGRTPTAGAATNAVLPIARALSIADPAGFLATQQGQRLVTYCQDYFQTLIAAVEGNPR